MRLRSLIDILRARVEDNHFCIPLFQTLRFNGGPVVFSWKKEQSDAARNHKDRTVIKHCNVTDMVPQEAGDNACGQFQKSHDCAVPADGTGTQELWH